MPNTKRVLVVDDDQDILDALQLTFESEGFEVLTKDTTEKIMETVSNFKPQAIVLDVLLSGEDGTVVCKKLKNTLKTKDIPIIMISAHPDAATSTKAAQANDFLAKPFDIYELIGLVAKYIH